MFVSVHHKLALLHFQVEDLQNTKKDNIQGLFFELDSVIH